MDRLEGVGKKYSDQCVPKMYLLRKITYGEFSEFIQEKKVHIERAPLIVRTNISWFFERKKHQQPHRLTHYNCYYDIPQRQINSFEMEINGPKG